MEAAIYSSKDFEISSLSDAATRQGLKLHFIKEALGPDTVALSKGFKVIVIFAGDDASAQVIHRLAGQGVQYIAIRAAGFDNVDLEAAHALGIRVANVPEYSPYAIAEHAVALLLALNRKLLLADRQVHAYNFTVGNLIGFDLHGKTAGIIGTGKIGRITARILHGFGCRLLGFDITPDAALEQETGIEYCDLKTLCAQSDIISIHTCLSPQTRYMINEATIRYMKQGVFLINTARGAVVNTRDVIDGLKSGQIAAFGADVYEAEKGVFFYDRSQQKPDDPMLQQLLEMPNVIITPHQAFATREALGNIADTTAYNISCWKHNKQAPHEL